MSRRLAPIAFAAALTLLSACAPMQWTRENTTDAEFSRDAAECRHLAWQEALARARMFRPVGPLVGRDAAGRPLLLARPVFPDLFDDRFMEEARLADFCLRARGYRLEPVAKPK
jgi:hypothetical protein